MKKLLILFGLILGITLTLNAQIPGTPDANGLITAGPPWVTSIPSGGGEIELQLQYLQSGIDTVSKNGLVHLFVYFGDSAVSKSYTTSWAHLTNASDSLFIQAELDGFTMSNDTITAIYKGGYDFDGNYSQDADNGETVGVRFYNVTQTKGIPVAGSQKGGGAGDFGSATILAHGDLNAGDKIVLQYKGDANGTAVFKNGVIRIRRIHE